MDPNDAGLPCIVQALASIDPSDTTVLPCIVQALAALPPSPTPKTPAPATPTAQPPPPPPAPESSTSMPPSPRRTRSGRAPEWTAAETLALVAAVAATDDGWARSVSAFQKWAIVAENLASSEGAGGSSSRRRARPAGDCKRRWEALAAEYAAVRRWEARTGGRYSEMGAATRRKAGLPSEFDTEVYGIMDALLADAGDAGGGGGKEGLVGAGGGVADVGEEEADGVGVGEEEEDDDDDDDDEEEVDGDDNEEEMQVDGGNANAPDDLEYCETEETQNEPKRSQIEAWELANKLNDNAQHIHMILEGEVGDDAGQNHAPADPISPNAMAADPISPNAMETTRQKADELIKSLGGLVSYLNQFTDLIKDNGFEDVVGVN